MRNNLVISVLQNLLFCVPKAAVLHGKSVGFASQKSRFRSVKSKLPFFFRIIFTKQGAIRRTTFPPISFYRNVTTPLFPLI
ncbi:hypothetical protein D2S45_06975 [Prevotella intermedia]|uniref:Uncharacterized protein n=1 Tax=Prevotella intermedia TaxID=28131 RepID=A0A3R7YLJ5_PREIN|nr:hypothetical protein D2S53_06735 [Prevotella intermedia]RRF87236.1 hypothetical protein D2S45_06975 [Prevotella intermedia]